MSESHDEIIGWRRHACNNEPATRDKKEREEKQFSFFSFSGAWLASAPHQIDEEEEAKEKADDDGKGIIYRPSCREGRETRKQRLFLPVQHCC